MCFQVIGYSDTDVAEYIYKSKPDLASLVNHLCKDLTDACTKNPPPLPKVPPFLIRFRLLKLKCGSLVISVRECSHFVAEGDGTLCNN